jgi:hypothetical protein
MFAKNDSELLKKLFWYSSGRIEEHQENSQHEKPVPDQNSNPELSEYKPLGSVAPFPYDHCALKAVFGSTHALSIAATQFVAR